MKVKQAQTLDLKSDKSMLKSKNPPRVYIERETLIPVPQGTGPAGAEMSGVSLGQGPQMNCGPLLPIPGRRVREL